MIYKNLCEERETVLKIFRTEWPEAPEYEGAPSFAWCFGPYRVLRDGSVETEDAQAEDASEEAAPAQVSILETMARCGLLDYPLPAYVPAPQDIVFPMEGHDGRSLFHLLSHLSARGVLLSRAVRAPGAFYADSLLLRKLQRHTPVTVTDFLCDLYGQEERYRGIRFAPQEIVFTGFPLRGPEERLAYEQLAACMVESAKRQSWVKPLTRNVRNKRYAFKTWLLSIGMRGELYAAARAFLLQRLPGCSSRKSKRRCRPVSVPRSK